MIAAVRTPPRYRPFRLPDPTGDWSRSVGVEVQELERRESKTLVTDRGPVTGGQAVEDEPQWAGLKALWHTEA
tara:strand:+ start:1028 stop:1246 length:219 start_codon:yes stop_codon:yes gene_type:complete